MEREDLQTAALCQLHVVEPNSDPVSVRQAEEPGPLLSAPLVTVSPWKCPRHGQHQRRCLGQTGTVLLVSAFL